MFDENIQDVDFTEDNLTNNIRGSALYYSTGQVAQMLDVPDSTIRYYTKVFDEILEIQVVNKQRKYTDGDIDKLKFIIGLKNENMSVKQILEYCQTETEFNSQNKIQVSDSSPLSIKVLAKALMEQQEIQFNSLKEELFMRVEKQILDLHNQSLEHQDRIRDDIKEEVAISIDECIEKSLDSKLDERFIKTEQSLEEMLEELKQTKQEFKIASVSMESIINSENPPSLFEKFRKKYFK